MQVIQSKVAIKKKQFFLSFHSNFINCMWKYMTIFWQLFCQDEVYYNVVSLILNNLQTFSLSGENFDKLQITSPLEPLEEKGKTERSKTLILFTLFF